MQKHFTMLSIKHFISNKQFMFGSKYKALESKYKALKAELADANKSINLLGKQNDSYKSTIEANAVTIEELKLLNEQTKKSVNAQINASLSEIGVKHFAVETITVSQTLTPSSALAKFKSLAGDEKTDFYRRHKDLITQGLGMSNKLNNA